MVSPERSVVHDEGPGQRYQRRHDGNGEDGDLDNSTLAVVVIVEVELSGLTVPMKRKRSIK